MANFFMSPADLILKEVNDSIVLQNLTGKVVFANDAAVRFLGFKSLKEIKKSCRSIFSHCVFQDKAGRAITQLPGHGVLVAQSSIEHTYRFIRPDGKKGWVQASASPIRDKTGRIKHVLNRFQDVTSQHEAEASLMQAKDASDIASRTKTEFVAHISHEIRTPLSAMIGFTDLLLREVPEGAQAAAYANVVRRNGQQLLRLIDDLLDLSKIESGKLETEQVRFSISQILSDVAAAVAPMAAEKKVPIEVDLDGAVPEWVTSDPTRVRQILVNIVGNAVKFTEKGKVTITIKMVATDGVPPKLTFLIRDGGSGIAEELQKKLFKPYSQCDPSVYRKYGGTGLGLKLSRQLAQSLGGDVTLIESQLGKGSLFAVTITPALTGNREKENEMISELPELGPKHAPAPTRDLTGVRVLLVEDAHDNQVLFDRVLRRAGMSLDMAGDGEEGIQKAISGNYDLVLMDVQMPGMDGYTATSILRKMGFNRPIIALTAHAMIGEKEKSLAMGCDDYMSKPVPFACLIEKIWQLRLRFDSPVNYQVQTT